MTKHDDAAPALMGSSDVPGELHFTGDQQRDPVLLHVGDDCNDGDDSCGSSDSSSPSDSESESECSSADRRYTTAGHALFFAGSLLQTVVSAWYVWALYDAGEANNVGDDDDDYDDDDYDWTSFDYKYYYLTLAGAGIYILNALVESIGKLKHQQRTRLRRLQRGDDTTDNESWYTSIGSSISFGTAATMELLAYVYWQDDTDVSAIVTYMVSMHIYFVSGVLTLREQQRQRNARVSSCLPQCHKSTVSETLLLIGGILFLVGSIIDVVMSYLYNPALHNLWISEVTLAWTDLASTVLWWIVSVLYIASECLECSGECKGGHFLRAGFALVVRGRGGGLLDV